MDAPRQSAPALLTKGHITQQFSGHRETGLPGEGGDLSFSLPAPLKSREKGKLYFNMNEGLIFVILS